MEQRNDLIAIVAADENWAIGHRGTLLCHLSADLKRFRRLTQGKAVLLGRKTLATFPGGKPLPVRDNWILSHDASFHVEGATVINSIAETLIRFPAGGIVIGGESVYRAFLPYCNTVYRTKIMSRFPDADAFFPALDTLPAWSLAAESAIYEEHGLRFQYETYQRV